MMIYVCSPYRASCKDQFDKQLEYTKSIAKEIVLAGHDVIVPHLYYTRFLDDSIDEERNLGIQSAINLLHVCDMIVVNTQYGISNGMKHEIAEADVLPSIQKLIVKDIPHLKSTLKMFR